MSTREDEDREENFAENMLIITARKSDFLEAFLRGLEQSECEIGPALKSIVMQAIAETDPLLFVTHEEKNRRRLNLKAELSKEEKKQIGTAIVNTLKQRGYEILSSDDDTVL